MLSSGITADFKKISCGIVKQYDWLKTEPNSVLF
jgi:hypothetical protein